MHSLALNRRKLWTMSCEALFLNVAASLTPETIVKLCHRHQIPLPEANRGHMALFQLAHEHCHRDAPFARQLQRYLNRKHTVLIVQLALRQPTELRSTVDSLFNAARPPALDTFSGILWAVCSDPREAIRAIEKALIEELHMLSHCLLLAQFKGYIQIVEAEERRGDAERENLQKELARLKAERDTLRHDVQHLKNTETHLAHDRARLQRQLNALAQRCERAEKPRQPTPVAHAPQSVTPRELKKLHYKLAKLTEALREKEDERQRLMAMVSSSAAMTADIPSEVTEQQQTSESELEGPGLDLHGKKVALIGGLTKASNHYEQAISQLGGRCLRHEGNLNQGQKKLARIIRQADVVFCPVDCVSHSTATSAKKLCRAFDKPCYFLRSSGVSHIRETLRQVALNAP